MCSQCIDKHRGLVFLPSNKLQQPDQNMNIISSLNFVQLHCFIGSNDSKEEFAGDTETDITGTVGEESETVSSSLQPRTTRKLDITYYYYYYYYKI